MYTAHARRDQLRLGLVPHAAQAARAARATTRSPGRWPTASARDGPWSPTSCARIDGGRGGGRARPGRRPRADGPVRARRCATSARFLGDRAALDVVAAAGGSAERLAEQLAAGMPFFDDRGFYKRAQITPSDLALAGVAEFADLDRLTIFADNLVPHVLRVDGVLRLRPGAGGAHRRRRAARRRAREEREIRACAVHACELIARRAGRAAAHRSTCGCGTAARSRATRRCRATARGRSTTEPQPPAGSLPARRGAAGAPRRPPGCLPVSSATMLLELAEPGGQALDARRPPGRAGAPSRRRGPRAARPSTRTGWPGLPTTVESRGHVVDHHRVRADLRAVAHRRSARAASRPSPTTTSSPDRRVALAALEAGAAERHALVERHVVADLGRLADHDAGAVVDEERRRRSAPPGWISTPVTTRVALASTRGASGTPASCSACATRWRAAPARRRR